MDGTILGSADDVRFEVATAGRSRWEYVATVDQELLEDGSRATVYVCRGRI